MRAFSMLSKTATCRMPAPYNISSIGSSRASQPVEGSKALVDAFNDGETLINGSTLGSTTFAKWLRMFVQHVPLRPHTTDYCDRCAELSVQVAGSEARLQRLRSGASTSAQDIASAVADVNRYNKERADHLEDTKRERAVYNSTQEAAARAWVAVRVPMAPSAADWGQITAVLAIDFMQEILQPHFRFSPQPGRT
jgi:hypothetical protein